MTKVTDYKQNINSAEAVRILSVDPTIVPIDGFKGQLAVSYDLDNPKLWQKQDFGKTTNWIKLVGLDKNVLPSDTVPLSIDSLAGWYDFSENVESKLEFSSFPSISRVIDQSLNNDPQRDLIQGNFARQALWQPAIQNGLGAAVFSTDVYPLPDIISNYIEAQGDFTIFFVSQQNQNGECNLISDSPRNTYIRYDASAADFRFAVSNNNNTRSDLPTTSVFANSVLRKNGVSATDYLVDVPENYNVGGQSPGDLFIGARNANAANPLVGYIGEIIIYERGLTDTEVTTILDYLKTKWASV